MLTKLPMLTYICFPKDELEQELERMKDKLQRQQKSSKNSADVLESHRRSSTSTSAANSDVSQEEVCEICERPGHDIFNCDLLKGEAARTTVAVEVPSDLFCDDCESHGHVAADCPHSLDVF